MQQTDRTFIDDMTKMIIRPHRDIYPLDKLGPSQMIVKGKSQNSDKQSFKYIEVTRKDIPLDLKGKKIQLSFFAPTDNELKKDNQSNNRQGNINPKKCVIYLHANSGSRCQGMQLVKYILPLGWSMALFDYRGSGLSEGEYTSMGVHESQDLERVLQYLSCHQRIVQFSLWGRSMGAVTILYYLMKQYFWNNLHSGILVKDVVLDSPFSNMQKLMHQIGSSRISLPEFVFAPIVSSISQRIISKIGVNLLKQLDFVDKIKNIKEKNGDLVKLLSKIGCLFLTSLQDKLVNASHVQILHKHTIFQPNQLHYLNGQHNDPRSDSVKIKCAIFLCEYHQHVKDIPLSEESRRKPGIGVVSQAVQQHHPMKKSELEFKKHNSTHDEPKRQTQFLVAPQKIESVPSPKYKSRKDGRIMTEDNVKTQKQSIKTSKIIEGQSKHIRSETKPQFSYPNTNSPITLNSMTHQNPTIIINNNYNVSVNLYDPNKPQYSPNQQVIPPINFNQTPPFQGYMTDRLNDNHLHHKYYVPYTTKTQKKGQYSSSSYSNISNTSNTSNISNSSFSKVQPQSQPVSNDKNFLIYHGRAQNSYLKNTAPNQTYFNHIAKAIPTSNNNPQKFQIPRIQFDGIDYNIDQQQQIKFTGRDYHNQRIKVQHQRKDPLLNVGKQNQQYLGEMQDKTKLSLSELRKIQKKEHQKCVMKISKIVSVKDKVEGNEEFDKIHLKKQHSAYQNNKKQVNLEPEHKYDSHYQSKQFPKQIRSLKTSLMSRRKVMERKNSETMENMKTSYLKYGQAKNNPISDPVLSPNHKILEYKVKIDHL